MPRHKTDATDYHAWLGLPDKGHAIKELVVCWVLLNQIARTELAPLIYPWLLNLMFRVSWIAVSSVSHDNKQ